MSRQREQERQAFLKAFYEDARGDPKAPVDIRETARALGLEHDGDTIFHYLVEKGLLATTTIGGMGRITADGIDTVEAEATGPAASSDAQLPESGSQTPSSPFRQVPFVFISSPKEGLETFRDAAKNACIRAKALPLMMESWTAEPRSVTAALEKRVAESDVVVLIASHRYGAEAPHMKVSYTEFEYNEAKRLGKPVLVFVCIDAQIGDPAKMDPEDLRRFKEFRRRLGSDLYEEFSTAEELEGRVFEALRNWIDETLSTPGTIVPPSSGLRIVVGAAAVYYEESGGVGVEIRVENPDALADSIRGVALTVEGKGPLRAGTPSVNLRPTPLRPVGLRIEGGGMIDGLLWFNIPRGPRPLVAIDGSVVAALDIEFVRNAPVTRSVEIRHVSPPGLFDGWQQMPSHELKSRILPAVQVRAEEQAGEALASCDMDVAQDAVANNWAEPTTKEPARIVEDLALLVLERRATKRLILEVFRKFQVGSNEVLPWPSLEISVEEWDRVHQDDFEKALNALVAEGAVLVDKRANCVLLTEAGYQRVYRAKPRGRTGPHL